MATNPMVQAQKLANSASIQVQKLANQATEKTFTFNSAEAEKNRQWEEKMSNTSHQREVIDLKAAGLNPVLSANQGAQSYTSASASGQAESGASGVAGIYGSTIGAMSQYESSRLSSAASLKAARTQAAAMRASAASSAAAARYQADMNYAANKYAWDKKQEMQKYEYKNKPAGNLATLADKYLTKAGFTGEAVKGLRSLLSGVKSSSLTSIYKGPNDFKLSKLGYQKMNQACSYFGIAQTKQNRYLVFKAINGNKAAIQTLKWKYQPPGYKHNSRHQR